MSNRNTYQDLAWSIRSIGRVDNFINGHTVAPEGDLYLDNFEPATGSVYAEVAASGAKDVDKCVKAALGAFDNWSQISVQERCAILLRIADLIDANRDRLGVAESVDNGKPLAVALDVDIPRASENFRFFGTAIQYFESESHLSTGVVNYTTRKPLGVVGCISPWNLPLYLFTWKIAPTLAAGNTVVAKPSELSPMTAFLLTRICEEAGLPGGVLNVVQGKGSEAGNAMVEHAEVKAISFTGGTVTGRKIASVAAPKFKKLSLELGGKNPNIVFADCDFDLAVQTSIRSSFSNQGEICLCGSRILIEESIYDKFKAALISLAQDLVVGDPMKDSTQVGSLISKDHLQKVKDYVDLAKQEGGEILAGGEVVELKGRCQEGYFMSPTIIGSLDAYCRTNQEEIFGPVVTLLPFQTEGQAVQLANATPYGLSTTVWTQNLSRAHRLAGKVAGRLFGFLPSPKISASKSKKRGFPNGKASKVLNTQILLGGRDQFFLGLGNGEHPGFLMSAIAALILLF